nr:unnamed protein product [Spirometra erinaceieuropaei]
MQPRVGCSSNQPGYLLVLFNKLLIVHTLLEIGLRWFIQSSFFLPQHQSMDTFTLVRLCVLLPAVAILFPCCIASSCFFAWYCRLLWTTFLFTSAQVLEFFFPSVDRPSVELISSLCDLPPSSRNSAFMHFSCNAISPPTAVSELLGKMTNHCNAPTRIHIHPTVILPSSIYCTDQMVGRIFAKHVLLGSVRLAAAALQVLVRVEVAMIPNQMLQPAKGPADFGDPTCNFIDNLDVDRGALTDHATELTGLVVSLGFLEPRQQPHSGALSTTVMTSLLKCCLPCLILLQLLLQSCAQVNTVTYSQAMYKAKREEHFAHLIKIAQLDDASIMIELVTRLIIQLLELLKLHRAVLLNATLTRPDMAPAEVDAAKAYAMVVETCPFLADLILRFPDSAREVLAPQRSRHNELIAWAFEFTRQSKFPSETDLKLLTLAEQELNLIPRPDNYVNPFADATKSRQVAELRELERRRAKQEMRRNLRRPRLTPRTEL